MEIVKYSKALADETRCRLMNILLKFELNVGEVVQVMEMGQSRVSRHLKILADSGLVECRREGLWAFYRAVESGRGRDYLYGIAALFADDAVFVQDSVASGRIVRERVASTRKFFDSIATDWHRLRDEVLGGVDLGAEIVACVDACQSVADLGCGPGELLGRLSEHAMSVIGVDNSPGMLEIAEERFAGREDVSLRIGELSHLPLRDAEVDCAVLSLVLHHLSEPAEALFEASRVIRSGGRLVVVEFDSHNNEVMRTEYGDRLLGIGEDKMRAMLERAGFSVDVVKRFDASMGMTVNLFHATNRDL